MEIMRLKAAAKDYIWGGTRLRDEFGVQSDAERVAEGWLLSCHQNGLCTVDSGKYAGFTLAEVLREHPEYIGYHGEDYTDFPILVKLIDAKEDLSIQVHPDDEYAFEVERSSGKTELWYVVDCDEGAGLICGFSDELTAEQFRQAVSDGTLLDYVHRYDVKKGDVFLIEAGTLHAIGKGIVIAEIQQNSDVTYRVYDYDRTDAEGNRRPLHIDKAIDVAITSPPIDEPGPQGQPVESGGHTEQLLADCEHFKVTLIKNRFVSRINVGVESFACVLVVEGQAQFSAGDCTVELSKGGCAFIPADTGSVRVSGEASYLLTTI